MPASGAMPAVRNPRVYTNSNVPSGSRRRRPTVNQRRVVDDCQARKRSFTGDPGEFGHGCGPRAQLRSGHMDETVDWPEIGRRGRLFAHHRAHEFAQPRRLPRSAEVAWHSEMRLWYSLGANPRERRREPSGTSVRMSPRSLGDLSPTAEPTPSPLSRCGQGSWRDRRSAQETERRGVG